MLVPRMLLRRHLTHYRHFSKCSIAQQLSTTGPAIPPEPLTIPTSESLDKIFSPKLEKIATDISTLNLLEVSELSQLLKKRLNLPDQPMMPANFSMQAFAPAANQEEVAATATKVKTEFTVKMTSFDEKQKVALIKEVKNLLEGYNLVQAKKFVEALPTIIKKDTTKEEAEKLKEAFTKVGAVIEII
ncbi:mitochondrial ribosomal protein L12 [Arctopsyche grandis]|uniref:mitochondrial ribosomal protein L12 n=1 Tax=Arctopsyche grandis TaxID=121162 RepID=UPI00406D9091